MGSISIRKSIRWLPDAASEPTSTLVVTSPNRRFVDLRVLLPEGADESWLGNGEAVAVDQLEWGIAGTSSSWERDDGKGGKVTRSQWRHWADSRTAKPEDATDEGDMLPQADGTTLEVGRMVNPATGRETDYEEVWFDPDPTPTVAGDEAAGKVRCVVLQIETSTGARGLVVRLGQFWQGFWRDGEEIAGERWGWDRINGWEVKLKIGAGSIEFPGEAAMASGKATEGEVVEVGGREWKVVEAS